MHIFWLSGMGCEGCSNSMLGASNPSVESLVLGGVPRLPRVIFHHPMLDEESGHEFMAAFRAAIDGTLGAPYIVVVEGSIPDDQSFEREGFFSALGSGADWPQGKQAAGGPDQPVRVTDWVWAMAPKAAACIAMGTCAAWGGIPAAAGNITGSMALSDYLGSAYRSAKGIPVINVPGCAPVGDNFTETLSLLLLFLEGHGPLPEFDDLGRPDWMFNETVHRHCSKAGYYEEGVFAHEPGDNQCLVEIGCWGPVVQCNIVERGAINHMGGCMIAGGACIGCTMPGFPDKYSPFYKSPPGSAISGTVSRVTGGGIRRLRRLSMRKGNHTVIWDNAGTVASGWGVGHNGEKTPLDKVNAFFYNRLQYRGSVNQAQRAKKQPLPGSRDILRQKGVDLEASVPVLGERVATREEL
ncbi:MAG: hydrogenase expression protein HypE [Actinomycetota bacterium]|nr:hydrogenase expression protein HypE [Actinomycetota bacterium]